MTYIVSDWVLTPTHSLLAIRDSNRTIHQRTNSRSVKFRTGQLAKTCNIKFAVNYRYKCNLWQITLTTNFNEPPSSFLLPPHYCGLGAGSIPCRAIVNKQCKTRGYWCQREDFAVCDLQCSVTSTSER